MESLFLSVASTLLALVVVLALAYVLLRVLRGPLLARHAAQGEAGDESMRFVRALPVGPRERVVLVDYRGARWMLGVTAGGISVLQSWPDASDTTRSAVAADAVRESNAAGVTLESKGAAVARGAPDTNSNSMLEPASR